VFNLEPTFISLWLIPLMLLSIPFGSKRFSLKYKQLYLLSISILFYFFFAGMTNFIILLILSILTFISAKSSNRYLPFLIVIFVVFYLITSKWIIAFDETNFFSAFIPLGISFFTFEIVHYLFEVKVKKNDPIFKLRDFLLFIFFFPTVVSGPIKRYKSFEENIKFPKIALQNANWVGVSLVSRGVIYKFAGDLLADLQTNMSVGMSYFSDSKALTFLIVVSFRIFLDFAGYSLMAIGLARLYRIEIPVNFNAPYLSPSLIEFWNRWHISLSSWVRDYIYIPLGGSRRGARRRSFNLLVAMLIIGLWHGFGFNFAIWGLWHGFGLSINHIYRKMYPEKTFFSSEWPRFAKGFKILLVFSYVSFGWVFFFYPLDTALKFMIRLLPFDLWS
jgi:alginate O-acetyltransferase complex protein AlgI